MGLITNMGNVIQWLQSVSNHSLLICGFALILLRGLCGNGASIISNSQVLNAYGQTDNAPAVQDSYWTDNLSSIPGARQTKVEVGPGEGSSTLAIVLVNKARQDITGVKGVLTLPEGFDAVASPTNQLGNNRVNLTSDNTSEASFRSVVKAGETFTLYFDINVLDDAKVKQYATNLKLLYSKVLDLGNLEID